MINRILNKRYRIISQIGTGGMSFVYKAFDAETSGTVAVKVLKPELAEDEQLLKRFRQEATAASCLSHKNIVKLIDVGCDDNTQYIVLDYIEGTTLKKYIEDKKQLDPKEAARIALQVAEGLSHAHSHGIIHRDIKPQNIIIQEDGNIKITDFGIARIVSDATRTTKVGGDVVGTVYYSSPEQVKGVNVDATTDIYSLGVVLYEMVTGKVPFDGETAVAIAMQHVSKEPEAAWKYNDQVPEALENIIHNAMAKSKDARYRSIDVMINDLKAFLDGKYTAPLLNIPVIRPPKKEKKKKTEEEKRENARYLNKLLLNIVLVLVLATLFCILVFGVFKVGKMMFENNFVISTVKTPSVVGKTSDEAKKILQDKQLIFREISTTYSSTVPKGCVIEQIPEAGETANEDDLVDVVVSLGAFVIDIPDFLGQDIVSAEYELRSNAYIDVGKYNYVESTSKKDTIIGQSIPAGEFSLDGNFVTIYFDISSGSSENTVEVKNFVGYTLTNANQIANIYEITIGDVTYEYSETVKKGVVISQSIEAGEVIEKTKRVDLVVSLGGRVYAEQMITISIPSTITPDSDGYAVLNIQTIRDGEFVDVYNGKIRADRSKAEVAVSEAGTKTLYIYINNKFIESRTVTFS